MTRDWRRHWALKTDFLSFQSVLNEQLLDIGAPLLMPKPVYEEGGDMFNVAGALIPLCLFLKYYW